MELVKLERRIRCDVGGCKEMADYSVRHEHGNLRNQLHLCKSCMKNMYELFGKEIVPESPTNMLSEKAKRGAKSESRVL